MGPLAGIKVVELVGLGPGPFCGMLLSDMGAEVISVERPGINERDDFVCMRGRQSIALNLKEPKAKEVFLDLCESADVVFEGYRPGVAERLGIGPDECTARNPALIYALCWACGHRQIEDLPMPIFADGSGQAQQPPTEVLLNERAAEQAKAGGIIALRANQTTGTVVI